MGGRHLPNLTPDQKKEQRNLRLREKRASETPEQRRTRIDHRNEADRRSKTDHVIPIPAFLWCNASQRWQSTTNCRRESVLFSGKDSTGLVLFGVDSVATGLFQSVVFRSSSDRRTGD